MKKYTFNAFDTDCIITIDESHEIEEIEKLINKMKIWHDIFNVFDEESEVSKFNQTEGTFKATDIFYKAAEKMIKYRNNYRGYFEPYVEILLYELRINKNISVLQKQKYLQICKHGQITFRSNGEISKSDAQIRINFHSFLKGYACDYMYEYLYETCNLRHFLIDFGGNIIASSNKEDRSYWQIGIQDPQKKRGELVHIIDLVDASLVTSASYERPIEIGEYAYSHIINPETGDFLPRSSLSISIKTQQSTDAEVLSTVLSVCNKELYTPFLKEVKGRAYVYENGKLSIY